MNTRTIAVLILVIVSAGSLGIARTAKADAAAYDTPFCAWQDTGSSPTCGYYSESFTLDGLDALKPAIYIYREDTYAGVVGGQFSLATTSSVDLRVNPYKYNWSYFGFPKSMVQQLTDSTDPMSLFKTATTENTVYGGESTTQGFVSSQASDAVLDFVVPKDDPSLGLPALLEGTTTIDNLFVKLDSLSVNPYVQTTLTDPRKEVQFFYSPLGIYKGKYIVVYKSKEIDTLDDKSQRTYAFDAPHIDGVTPLAADTAAAVSTTSAASAAPVPESRSWFMQVWCYLKSFFGRAC